MHHASFGEQPIASLQVGDHVTSYDPTTGKATTQTITHVFVHHDTDRLDVTLTLPATSGVAQSQTAAQDATAAREQRALTLSHGRRGPPDATTTASSSSTAATSETIHTTANHPWLTADRGWVDAGQLHAGEPVRLLDGATAVVVGLHAVPGAGPMWDLSLDAVHTFAVGTDQAVVHNVGPMCDINDSSSEISQVSMRARMEHGIEPGRNVAVYRIGRGESARYLAAASDAGLHSEEILNSFIDDPANGLSRGDVTGIYSERMPCVSPGHMCAATMSNYPNAQNDLSYSLSPDIDARARIQNAGKIGYAMGEYAGTPAGLPGYQWITTP